MFGIIGDILKRTNKYRPNLFHDKYNTYLRYKWARIPKSLPEDVRTDMIRQIEQVLNTYQQVVISVQFIECVSWSKERYHALEIRLPN
jgi:hypothetical protein